MPNAAIETCGLPLLRFFHMTVYIYVFLASLQSKEFSFCSEAATGLTGVHVWCSYICRSVRFFGTHYCGCVCVHGKVNGQGDAGPDGAYVGCSTQKPRCHLGLVMRQGVVW